MQIKTIETAHNKKCEMTACTDGTVIVGRLQKCEMTACTDTWYCDSRQITEMWKKVIRNCTNVR